MTDQTLTQLDGTTQAADPADFKRRRNSRVMLALLLLIAALAAFWYWWDSRAHESTDDAFIDGDIMQISSRVAGQVLKVHVRDNQHVKKGDLLLEIDPHDFEARLAEARGVLKDAAARQAGATANLQSTSVVTDAVLIQARAQVALIQARLSQDEAGTQAAEAMLRQAEARKAAAEAENHRAGVDAERYRALYSKDEISKQALDRAETDVTVTAANLAAASQAALAAAAQQAQAKSAQAATLASLDQAEGRLREAQSGPHQIEVRRADLQAARGQLEQRQASLQQAELNLSYTRIYSPDDGYVTRRSVEPGNYVQVGQALMAVVSERLWVVANFKETQLRHMRPGQAVRITIEAYPQRTFRGQLDSVQSGSGARFSLMPPENATGNYVKVVQRVPTKILFTEPLPTGYRIGPGMSVVPEVTVR